METEKEKGKKQGEGEGRQILTMVKEKECRVRSSNLVWNFPPNSKHPLLRPTLLHSN